MSGSAGKRISANILIDRLLHASDSSDAQSSLQSLIKSVPADADSAVNIISGSNDCLYAISTLVVKSALPSGIQLEEGQVSALELIQSVLKNSSTPAATVKSVLLEAIEPSNSTSTSHSSLATSPLLHSLLDCLCNPNSQNSSPYPRILSLELITKAHQLQPTLTQETLLSAPEGFHHLISLLHNNDPSKIHTAESIRNATLLLLTNLSKNSSVIRKLLLFSEGYERVLGIAVSSNVEKAVVMDCISLCKNLLVEDGAGGSCDLFFGGRDQVVVGGCVRLLDARFFKQARSLDLATPIRKDDDLDDLLHTPPSSQLKKQTFRVPKMTKDEEEICHAVLDLFAFAMEVGEANPNKKSSQNLIPKRFLQNQAVMGAILSFALYSPHMETQIPFYASVPSISVQCHALDILSEIISKSSMLFTKTSDSSDDNNEKAAPLQNIFPLYEFFDGEASQHSIDRLILLCYRKGSSSSISSHSRSALLHVLDMEYLNLLILHSLAPPPPDFEGDEIQNQPMVPIIKSMIQSLPLKSTSYDIKERILSTLRVILTKGGSTAKELLLRFPVEEGQNSPFYLIDFLFHSLDNDDELDYDSTLNLLCSWSFSSPDSVMETILRLPETLSLASKLQSKNAFVALLLGLWLDYFSSSEDSSSQKDEISGWSKDIIIQIIQSYGVSKYTTLLDSFARNDDFESNYKLYTTSLQGSSISSNERKEGKKVHLDMVARIRKSLVSALTTSSSSTATQEEAEMAQLLSQYQYEISNLQSQLTESDETIAKQAFEIKNLKLKFQPVTPLDEALAEQVDKAALAEQKNLELEKTLNIQKKLVSNLETIKSDLEKEIDTTKQERDDREEELTALSSAYSTLETEYRKVVPSNDGTKSGDGVSSDVLELKIQIDKLHEQVRAGDEWMTMAVGRMETMAAENASLLEQVSDKASGSEILSQHIENNAKAEKRVSELTKWLNIQKKLVSDIKMEKVQSEKDKQKRIDDLLSWQNTQKALVSDLKMEKAKLQKDMEHVKQEKNNKVEELARLSTKFTVLEAELKKTMTSHSPNELELKGEIKKLKGQVQAGDEWMSMAVGRMDTLAKENESLLEQVSAQASNASNNKDELTASLQEGHKEEIEELNKKIKTLSNHVDKLKKEEGKVKDDHKSQLQIMNEEISNLVNDLNQEREKNKQNIDAFSTSVESSAVQRLETKVQKLLKDLEDKDNLLACKEKQSSNEKTALINERDSIETEKDIEIANIKNEFAEFKESSKFGMEEKQSHIASLLQQVDELKSRQNSIEGRNETTNAEDFFSVKPDNETVSFSEGEESLRSELLQLREAYDQAQEWMSNAHEYQETTARDIDHLRDENNSLKHEIQDLRNSSQNSEIPSNQYIAEEEHNRLLNEINHLKEENEDFRSQISTLQSKSKENNFTNMDVEKRTENNVMENLEDLTRAQNEIQSLKEKNQKLSSEIEIMKNDTENLNKAKLEVKDYRENNQKLSSELEIMKKDIENFDKMNSQIDSLKNKNQSLYSEVETMKRDAENLELAKMEIDSLKKEIVETQLKADRTSSKYEELESELAATEENLKKVQDKLNLMQVKNKEEIEGIRSKYEKEQTNDTNELQRTKNKCQELETQLNEIDNEKNNLLQKQATFTEAMNELKSRLTEYQNWTEAAQGRISDLEEEKDVAERKCDEIIETQKMSQLKIDEYSSKIGSLQSQLDEAIKERNNTIEQKLVEVNELNKKLTSLNAENNASAEQHEAIINTITEEKAIALKNWQDESNHLKSTISNLQIELTQHNERERDVISQWEVKCTSLSSQLHKQEQDLIAQQDLSKKVAKLEEELKKANEFSTAHESTKADFESKLAGLELQVKELQAEVIQKDEIIASSHDEVAEYVKRLEEDREQTEDVLHQWKITADELENNVNALEQRIIEQNQTIEEQKVDAETAISHWENRCSSLQDQLEELEKQFDETEERVIAQDEEIQELKHTKTMDRKALESAKFQIESLTKDMEYSNAKSEEERKALIAEIESRVEKSMSLEIELDGAQSTRDDIIKKLEEYRDLHTLEQQARVQTEDTLRGERNHLNQLEVSLKSETELKNQLETELEKCKADASSTKEKLRKVEDELGHMQLHFGKMQGELQDATGALSLLNTDNASNKATEMATQALRAQIAEILAQQEADRDAINREHEGRLQAEQELEKIKIDLALLTHAKESMGDSSIQMDGHVRKLASKAADDIFRKERQEMEELRTMLEKAREELSVSKASEKNTEERSVSLRMHASMCEQEVMNTKNDILFLNKTIEELKESESKNIITLQHRISELERDREKIARAHIEDMEMLKVELSQVSLEKDRLLHSLHESEKTNASLVVADTLSRDHGHEADANGAELARLKIANAQLLAAAAETGSKTERRIREAVAANAASNEAEILLERDLREAAEKSSEEMQLEVDKLRQEINKVKSEAKASQEKDLNSVSSMESSSQDLAKLKEQLMSKFNECDESNEKNKALEDNVKSAQSTIAKLKEECEHYKALSREIDRGVNFEASVATEIARLRAESSNPNELNGHAPSSSSLVVHSQNSSYNNNNNTGKTQQHMSADEMYDHIQELKYAVKQERNQYRNLLEDHEELLAVLAQQDIEIDSLRAGLETYGGEEAIEEALRQVEASMEQKVQEHDMPN